MTALFADTFYWIALVPQSRESFLSGMALYGARPDKGYSLTDCIS
jgi:hypothetical protein